MRLIFTFSIFILLLVLGTGTHAQNLVPNPSFEFYNSCPTGYTMTGSTTNGIVYSPGYNQFPTIQNWVSPNVETPDYFNACSSNAFVQVPNNRFGHRYARTGNAYAGMFVADTAVSPNDVREYVESQLIQPMVAGKIYYVSFYVSLASGITPAYQSSNIIAIDKVGAYFSNTLLTKPTAPRHPLYEVPQVLNKAGHYINDTLNWMKVEGDFIATGGEDFITIGHFNDTPLPFHSAIPYRMPFPNSHTVVSYMFLDDVCVTAATAHKTTVELCKNLAVLTADTGGTKYTWSTGDTTRQIIIDTPGIYWAKTSADCALYIDTINVIQSTYPSPKLNIGNDTTIDCASKGIILSANHTYQSYLWNTGAISPTTKATHAGVFMLTVTDSCSIQSDTINITYGSPHHLDIGIDTVLNCGDSIVLSANATYYTYHWSTGDTTQSITIRKAGTYALTVMDSCATQADSINIRYGTSPKLDIGKDTAYCNVTQATLSTNHNYLAYLWNTGETTKSIVATQPGMYSVRVIDSCSTQYDSINVLFSQVPSPTVYNNDTNIILCQNAVAPLLSAEGMHIRWYVNGSVSTTPPIIKTDSAYIDTIYVSQSSETCESQLQPITISVLAQPIKFSQPDTNICKGDQITIGQSLYGVSYLWNTGADSCCINVSTPNLYIVKMFNDCNTLSDSILVNVVNCQECLWAPNAFTPNQDGKNDIYKIVSVCPMASFHIIITDRWGQIVYESSDAKAGWDGTYKGEPMPIDTYFYLIKAMPDVIDAKEINIKGDVTLIR